MFGVKRFVVFGFNHYEEVGGFNDYLDDFDTDGQAKAFALKQLGSRKDYSVQIVDLKTREQVEFYNPLHGEMKKSDVEQF